MYQCEDKTLQDIANDMHAIVWTHFRQCETGLFYMYIDPYEIGRVNLPTVEQVLADVPNSNGWSTPLENSNYTSSQYLQALISRYNVTQKIEHADQARSVYQALIHLWRISTSPSFIPRGVLRDGQTHYRDVSIDHITFWLMAMWRYYRSVLAEPHEKNEIRRAITTFMVSVEKNHWNCFREDGLITYWADLRHNHREVFRSHVALLCMLAISYDITQDSYWRERYIEFRDLAKRPTTECIDATKLASEPTWISSQTAWLLNVLFQLETDEGARQCFQRSISAIARRCLQQVLNYREYDFDKACADFNFASHAHRDVMFGIIGVSLDLDAEVIKESHATVEQAIRSYDHRKGKIVDLVDAMFIYYWVLAEKGLVAYEPSKDRDGDPTIEPVPSGVPYKLHPVNDWFDCLTRTYRALPTSPDKPASRFFYPCRENLERVGDLARNHEQIEELQSAV